jgi:hypothetical protein
MAIDYVTVAEEPSCGLSCDQGAAVSNVEDFAPIAPVVGDGSPAQ